MNTRKSSQQYDLKGQGSIQISGGSRIFPKGCANSQIGIILPIFYRKLHENERIWTPRGRVPDAPLRSANADKHMKLCDLKGQERIRINTEYGSLPCDLKERGDPKKYSSL